MGSTEENRALVTTIRRLEDTIKMDFQNVRWTGMECIDLVKDRVRRQTLANDSMKLRVP